MKNLRLLLYPYSLIITSMNQNELYTAQLDQVLTRRAAILLKEEIPALKEASRTFHAAFTGLYKVLKEKGLIQEDQYHYEQKISNLKVPPSDPFTDSEMFSQLSIRLSAYIAQLDYLNNFFFFSPDSLNLKNIKSILGLIDYFHWSNISVNAAHIMTRSLSSYLDKIKQAGDGMAINILSSSVKVLRDQNRIIKGILKKVSFYARQNYKLNARMNVLSQMTLDPKRTRSDRSGTLQAIKFEFPVRWKGAPFFRELIEEILDEDFGPDGEKLRQEVLESLEVKQKSVQKKKRNLDEELKKVLLDQLSELSTVYIPLETIIIRLDSNSRMMDENPASFTQKLSRWINRVMLKKNEVYYEIPVSHLGRGSKREKMNFTSYINRLRNKATFYKNLNNSSSPSYTRAAESSCPELDEFLMKNLQELKKMVNRLGNLEKFFRESAEGSVKTRIKGYSAEQTQLKWIISRVTTGLKNYQVRQQEIDQLKNLGIDPQAGE